MSYESLFYEFSAKWGFSCGLRGVVGSYNLIRSCGELKLIKWVSDRRCYDGRKTKEIFATYEESEMRQYLTENEPK